MTGGEETKNSEIDSLDFYNRFLSYDQSRPSLSTSTNFYRKASGKPLALAMEMNTVVALATLNKFIPKKLYLQYFVIK